MIYILDTNVFRVLENYYPASFPSFWTSFDEAVAAGEIISVEEVFKEIENGSASDDLSVWVETNKAIFRTPTEDDLQFISTIFEVPQFQSLVGQNQLLQGMPAADPFIIAAAKIVMGCVVTEERMKPNAVKIPNVCGWIMPVTVRPVNSHRNEITARKGPTLGQPFYWGAVVLSYERLRRPTRSASHPCDSSRDDCCMYLRNDLREIKSLADIPHIKPEVSKEPTILYVDDCTDAPERCQTRYRAYWTTFWCGGWWSIGWESHLRYTMAPFQPLQTRTSPLVTPHHLR